MENDEPKKMKLELTNNNTPDNVFNLEYCEQNVNNNIEYQKWKKSMLIEYGNNSKEFRCDKDNIIFYSTYDDCLDDPPYKCNCPICREYICYFCLYHGVDEFCSCCLKHSFSKSFFYYGPKFVNKPLNKSRLFILLPAISTIMIIIFFIKTFYIGIIPEKSKIDEKLTKQYTDMGINGEQTIIIILINFIGVLLCIPFIIFYNYFIILLIIISIPSKLIPLKYYLGVICSDLLINN